MILVGIDIGKNSHYYTIVRKEDGEILSEPSKITNDLKGFDQLVSCFRKYRKTDILIGMEDTGHYHFPLLKHLLDIGYTVALINPVITDLTRKANGEISKTDKLDTLTICDVLCSNRKDRKPYRISKVQRFDLYEPRCLTRHHHNLKEELNVYTNRLQKCIAIAFPEFNSLFSSKLKAAAKDSIGISSVSEVIQIKHLIAQIELINEQLEEIDKKIEEFSRQTNSPILSIPGISHFSGTSILSELGDIDNFTNHRQIIKYAGVAPLTYESSQFKAQHTKISKKGSKYFRKTLYQIILPVIQQNKVFKDYYALKISQGKSHRCAQGHCVRKLLRVIFHLLKTGQQFDPSILC